MLLSGYPNCRNLLSYLAIYLGQCLLQRRDPPLSPLLGNSFARLIQFKRRSCCSNTPFCFRVVNNGFHTLCANINTKNHAHWEPPNSRSKSAVSDASGWNGGRGSPMSNPKTFRPCFTPGTTPGDRRNNSWVTSFAVDCR